MRVVLLLDLSDERRSNKPWLPADDRDVTNGLVRMGADDKPECLRHGAMNRVDQHRSLWRCSEFRCGVGAELDARPHWALSQPGRTWWESSNRKAVRLLPDAESA